MFMYRLAYMLFWQELIDVEGDETNKILKIGKRKVQDNFEEIESIETWLILTFYLDCNCLVERKSC